MESHLKLKLPGRDGSWMGDYATCGSCHLVHTARFTLAPRLLQRYNQRVSRTNSTSLLVYYIQARHSLSSRRSNFKDLFKRINASHCVMYSDSNGMVRLAKIGYEAI